MTAKPSSQYLSISPFLSSAGERSFLAQVIQKIARNAIELLNLDDCAIALLDEAGAHLVFQTPLPEATGSTATPESQPAQLSLKQEPLATLARHRETLVLRDAHLDVWMQPLATDASCSLACLPLLVQEQFVGVLFASSSRQDAFAAPHLRALDLLAEQVELALENAYRETLVHDANRTKANFLSLVTHELRSPLNTINGYLDLLLEGIAGEITEQQQEFIRRARSSSEHLYALLEDLLLAARSDAGQLRLSRASVSLEDLIGSAIDELEVTAQDCKVELATNLPADLPDLLLDGTRMQQVLRNLLINALRATPAGGRVTVSVSLLPASRQGDQERVEVRVCDTGIGIAPEYHERIFERFFQIPRSESGRNNGQGLGLTIVKMIVELHGGQVRVESVPGAGSTFAFILNV